MAKTRRRRRAPAPVPARRRRRSGVLASARGAAAGRVGQALFRLAGPRRPAAGPGGERGRRSGRHGRGASCGTEPVDLLAQSMGGVVALSVALRNPRQGAPDGADGDLRRRRRAPTSTGFDWRANYSREYPNAAAWITADAHRLDRRIPDHRLSDAAALGRRRSDQPGRGGRAVAGAGARTPGCMSSQGGEHDLARDPRGDAGAMVAELPAMSLARRARGVRVDFGGPVAIKRLPRPRVPSRGRIPFCRHLILKATRCTR